MAELILYSTNTWLAFNIAERYFQAKHYVWCTPFFDSIGSNANPLYTVAATSCPKEIYLTLHKEVLSGDKHSDKIEKNKLGIIKAAAVKRAAGVITSEVESDIVSVVKAAEINWFKPLLYIIPLDKVIGIKKDVPIADKAHPFSTEYIIENLPRDCFDVIELV